MTLYTILYRNKEHELNHLERSHILGIFDSESQAESALEKLSSNGKDFRRMMVVPFELNKIYYQ